MADIDGISGIYAPFPVSKNYQPAYKSFIPIEIPPETWWDVRYIAYNRVVEIDTLFLREAQTVMLQCFWR